jgi:hypothetical protein
MKNYELLTIFSDIFADKKKIIQKSSFLQNPGGADSQKTEAKNFRAIISLSYSAQYSLL